MLKKLLRSHLKMVVLRPMARFGSGSPATHHNGHQAEEHGDHHDDHHDDHHADHDHGHNHDIHPHDQHFELRVSPHKRTKTMYYSDPEQMALRICSLLALHDDLKVSEVRLDHTWKQLGLSDFSKMEFLIEVENEFMINIADEDHEKFKNVYDLVQFLSKSCFIH